MQKIAFFLLLLNRSKKLKEYSTYQRRPSRQRTRQAANDINPYWQLCRQQPSPNGSLEVKVGDEMGQQLAWFCFSIEQKSRLFGKRAKIRADSSWFLCQMARVTRRPDDVKLSGKLNRYRTRDDDQLRHRPVCRQKVNRFSIERQTCFFYSCSTRRQQKLSRVQDEGVVVKHVLYFCLFLSVGSVAMDQIDHRQKDKSLSFYQSKPSHSLDLFLVFVVCLSFLALAACLVSRRIKKIEETQLLSDSNRSHETHHRGGRR